MKPLGRPRDGESAATRERLLAAAREAFARVGYAATTNKMIAEAAGLTPNAIYHYYASKAELYAEVYGQVQELVQQSFEHDLATHPGFVERFAATLDASVRLNRSDPSITGFVVNVPYETQRHPELVELLAPTRAKRQSMAGRIVDDAVARGELSPDVDPAAVRDLINAIFSGLARLHNHVCDTDRHARAVEAMKMLLRDTLVTPVGEVRQPVEGRQATS